MNRHSRRCGTRTPRASTLYKAPTLLAGMSFALALGFAPPIPAAYAETVRVGYADNAIGTLVIVRIDGVQERLQGTGQIPLYEGDVLRTDTGSQAVVKFKEGVKVALNEDTSFKILSRWVKEQPSTRIIRLSRGEVWVTTLGEGPFQFEVETPVATAAIEGTEFDLKVQEDGQSILTVVSGIVKFGTAFGTCPIKPGTISYGVRGKKCTKPVPTDVKKSLEWTQAVK